MKLSSLSRQRGVNAWRSWLRVAGLAVVYLILVITVPGWAAEWSLTPSMSTKAYYNDNLLLTPLPHDPTYGYWISPAADFTGKTERLEVSGRAALDFVDYYGGEPNRYTNIFLPLTMRYRTEQDEWGLTGGFSRDNTLMGSYRRPESYYASPNETSGT